MSTVYNPQEDSKPLVNIELDEYSAEEGAWPFIGNETDAVYVYIDVHECINGLPGEKLYSWRGKLKP